ncbi:pectate lyase-like adhesive domain-containing protein [Gemmiger sp.]|uniref:pectate lyase-like adhesive domain-containing protein n=1 Tax=Gemmiger sp. TaxID=2049027 RepID=UPI003A917308
MKKQLVSILFALCMVLCLVPTAAFAEESTETPPECSCETACTAESMNAECPVCGAEGALPENCEKCTRPADDAAAQPEGEVSDPQPETALTALIGGSATEKEVSTVDELTKAIADVNFDTVKLTTDIDISNTLTVNRTVTLDLNGHVLQYKNDEVHGSPLAVESGGHLTIKDSGSNATHRFKPNSDGLWVLDEDNGTETVYGGVITGGTGYPIQFGSGYTAYYGGAVYIKSGGKLTMEGGNIVGCSAVYGGGVYVEGEFVMTGGSIIGCAADRGGGVYMRDNDAVFNMSGSAAIRCCKAASKDASHASGGGVYALGAFTMSGNAAICDCECITGSGRAAGGGVYVSYHNRNTEFTMSGNAVIENCKVTTSAQNGWTKSCGGGVLVSSRSSLTLKDQAAIRKCSAENTAGGATYGGGIFAEGTLTIAGRAEVGEGCSAAVGSGIYMEVGPDFIVSQNLYANGGVIAGEVVLNNSSTHGVTLMITGSDESVTEFKGSVLNNNGIIEKGKFTGEVTNNGTISGGVFNSTVSGSGIINGGTFNGTPDLITGSGTETDPYQINTAEGLKWFRDKVNDAKTEEEPKICAVLTAAIDLKNEPWTPIGNYTEGNKIYYEGTFDGGGYTISGLNVTGKFRCASLFGAVKGGTIKNLTVAGNVSHNYYSTGLDCHVGGIVGSALDAATIENCSNNCSVTGGSGDFIGGIAGSNTDNARIIDCYNVGTITGTINGTGGVTGLNMGTISNCYNVGTIKTLYNSNAVGEIVGSNHGTVENCYYLAGTNLNAVGQSDSNGNITKTESKTAAEFADGTVLALLKADRDNSPWDSCQYVAAAKMTLPVFKGQGDAHDHTWSAWTSNGDGTHSRRCTCNAVETVNCSGGKATCKDKAICEICGDSYGSPDPNNHADLKHIDAKAATAAEEGNIAYWYCGGCGKYFADAAATKEITRADTVTAKLPQPTTPPTTTPTAAPTTAPQAAEQPRRTAQPTVQPTAAPTVQPVSTIPATGDTSSPILWAALLLCSGAGLAVTAYKKNRHRS